MWSCPLSLSQPRTRLLSPSPKKSTLLLSTLRISLDVLLCGDGKERISIASLQHLSLFVPAKVMFLVFRDCHFCHPQNTAS